MNAQKLIDEIKRRAYIIRKVSPELITHLSRQQHMNLRSLDLTELIEVKNEALKRD
jgi:hypothetical protein